MRITNTIFILFVSSLVVFSLPARSQETKETEPGGQPEAEVRKFKDWAVRCEQRDDTATTTCILSQRVALDSGQTVMSVTIAYLPDADDAAAVFRLPLGIFLPAGAVVEVDKTDQIRLVIQRCDQRGCWAPLKLDGKTIKLFKKGREARVGFKDTNGKTIAVPLSLQGFTAGFDEVAKTKKKTTNE